MTFDSPNPTYLTFFLVFSYDFGSRYWPTLLMYNTCSITSPSEKINVAFYDFNGTRKMTLKRRISKQNESACIRQHPAVAILGLRKAA